MAEAICIGINGAESTGKTTLAAELAAALGKATGQSVAWVPEVLRQWCENTGRTPLAHEQANIMRSQHQRIDAAAQTHSLVVCDTTALMTAVYSRMLFGDRTLDERAAVLHRRSIHMTLVTAIDLPWVADGFMRDGPQVREPVDRMLRELMQTHRIACAVVRGEGPARLQQALAAVQGVLRPGAPGERGTGRFSGLNNAQAGRRAWSCDCCPPEQEAAVPRQHSAQ
jgi:nicotinamide riboside kinase